MGSLYEYKWRCAATRAVLTRIFASAVMPETTHAMWSSMRYSFSLVFPWSNSLEVTNHKSERKDEKVVLFVETHPASLQLAQLRVTHVIRQHPITNNNTVNNIPPSFARIPKAAPA
jgi:hypothetical protein